MIDEKSFNRIAIILLIAILIILSFVILRPILLSCLFGLILAFIFHPLYRKVRLLVKNESLSAFIICILLLIIILVPLFFLIPVLIKQTFEVYLHIQKGNFLEPFTNLLSGFLHAPEFSQQFSVAASSFVNKMASSFLNRFTNVLLNSPTILLNILLILFIFFFGLRDGEKFIIYIQDLSPLSKEVEKKIFQQFKDITYSVVYGNIIVGIVQGVVTGIALLVLGIPNAVVLTLLAIFFSMFPILGPWLIWVPVDFYLFTTGRTTAAFGLLIYGLIFISWIDNLLRPLIISKRTKINSAIVLVGMIGGLFVFGILGLILGPLIIAYLLLLLESFRNQKIESILLKKVEG